MSLRTRMSAIVGDENTVGRYLLEKAGHTALLAMGIVAITCAIISIVYAAIAATLLYVVGGKLWWHHRNGAGPWDLKDLAFDTLISGLVIALALMMVAPLVGLSALCVWCVLFLVLDNNNWGSPS